MMYHPWFDSWMWYKSLGACICVFVLQGGRCLKNRMLCFICLLAAAPEYLCSFKRIWIIRMIMIYYCYFWIQNHLILPYFCICTPENIVLKKGCHSNLPLSPLIRRGSSYDRSQVPQKLTILLLPLQTSANIYPPIHSHAARWVRAGSIQLVHKWEYSHLFLSWGDCRPTLKPVVARANVRHPHLFICSQSAWKHSRLGCVHCCVVCVHFQFRMICRFYDPVQENTKKMSKALFLISHNMHKKDTLFLFFDAIQLFLDGYFYFVVVLFITWSDMPLPKVFIHVPHVKWHETVNLRPAL